MTIHPRVALISIGALLALAFIITTQRAAHPNHEQAHTVTSAREAAAPAAGSSTRIQAEDAATAPAAVDARAAKIPLATAAPTARPTAGGAAPGRPPVAPVMATPAAHGAVPEAGPGAFAEPAATPAADGGDRREAIRAIRRAHGRLLGGDSGVPLQFAPAQPGGAG